MNWFKRWREKKRQAQADAEYAKFIREARELTGIDPETAFDEVKKKAPDMYGAFNPETNRLNWCGCVVPFGDGFLGLGVDPLHTENLSYAGSSMEKVYVCLKANKYHRINISEEI